MKWAIFLFAFLCISFIFIYFSGCNETSKEDTVQNERQAGTEIGGRGLPDWNSERPPPREMDENLFLERMKRSLGLPAEAEVSDIKQALGLPESASMEEVRQSFFEKFGGDFNRGFGGDFNEFRDDFNRERRFYNE